MVNYQPKLLAKHPAELYNIDFDKASLEARGHRLESAAREIQAQ